MNCDKYTLVFLIITNTINIIQFLLYNTCMILNYNHPDIHIIRSLIYARILYDIFSFYKLCICFLHFNHTLPHDLNAYIKRGSYFVILPQIPSFFTYHRLNNMYDKIQSYPSTLMYVVYMINHYISYLFVYSLYIVFYVFIVIVSYMFIQKIKGTPTRPRPRPRPTIYTNFVPTNDVCSICLEPDCNYKTICGHFFHRLCILRWVTLSNKYECPICRNNISHQN